MFQPITLILLLLIAVAYVLGRYSMKRKLCKLAEKEIELARETIANVTPVASFNLFPGSEQYRPITGWLLDKHPAIDTLYLWHDSSEFEIFGAWTRTGHVQPDPSPIRIAYSDVDDPNEIIRFGEAIIDIGKECQQHRVEAGHA